MLIIIDIRSKTIVYINHITKQGTLQHALLEGKVEGRRSRGGAQPGRENKKNVDWEHNKKVRIWLHGCSRGRIVRA